MVETQTGGYFRSNDLVDKNPKAAQTTFLSTTDSFNDKHVK